MDDKVLVVRTDVLKDLALDRGFTFDVERHFKAIFKAENSFFLERKVAEVSLEYRQVIPYVVLCAARKVCTYVRGRNSGEARLEGKRSIGFGGHIIPSDRRPLDPRRLSWYLHAVRREVCEEVGISAPKREEVLGLIIDDLSAVDRVHLGILHLWEVAEREIRSREEQISAVAFMTIRQLGRHHDELESWSQRSFDVLKSALSSRVTENQIEESSLLELATRLRKRSLRLEL
jgi:predicted NUDIX family phosphoesterase